MSSERSELYVTSAMTPILSESGSLIERGKPHKNVQNVCNLVQTETQKTEILHRWMKIYWLFDKNVTAIFRFNNFEVTGSDFITLLTESLWMGNGPIDCLLTHNPIERFSGCHPHIHSAFRVSSPHTLSLKIETASFAAKAHALELQKTFHRKAKECGRGK